jgi:hypothetical protein
MQWDARWQPGQACLCGRVRRFRVKRLRCHWPVSGPEVPVQGFVFEAAGYPRPWFLVTSASKLSAAQVVEVFAARGLRPGRNSPADPGSARGCSSFGV